MNTSSLPEAAPVRSAIVAMLSRGLGGIEQAALDQAQMLRDEGVDVVMALARGAGLIPAVEAAGMAYEALRPAPAFDYLAARRLRRLVETHKADLVLCHGVRPLQLLTLARPGRAKLVIMGHNYKAKRWPSADAAIVMTDDIARHAVSVGCAPDRVHVTPNIVEVPEAPPVRPAPRTPPVIGTMGRFVRKKGFHVFLDACALLRDQGHAFRAVIGGDGDEKAALEAQAAALDLKGLVEFKGWVSDKAAFFADLDVFCLPSLHEPFGIVVLEAFAHGAPLAAAASEGPSMIITDGETGLMAPCDDAPALAAVLQRMLEAPDAARARAEAAFAHVRDVYSKPVVSKQLMKALAEIQRTA